MQFSQNETPETGCDCYWITHAVSVIIPPNFTEEISKYLTKRLKQLSDCD